MQRDEGQDQSRQGIGCQVRPTVPVRPHDVVIPEKLRVFETKSVVALDVAIEPFREYRVDAMARIAPLVGFLALREIVRDHARHRRVAVNASCRFQVQVNQWQIFVRRSHRGLDGIGQYAGGFSFVAPEARPIVIFKNQLRLFYLFCCHEIVRVVAMLTSEKLVVLLVVLPGYDDMILRCQAASLGLFVLVLRVMHRLVEFVLHAIEIIGLVILRALFLPGVTVHAQICFHVHVRVLLEPLFMAVQTFRFSVIRTAKAADPDCHAARLSGHRVGDDPVWTGVAGETLKPLEVIFAILGMHGLFPGWQADH